MKGDKQDIIFKTGWEDVSQEEFARMCAKHTVPGVSAVDVSEHLKRRLLEGQSVMSRAERIEHARVFKKIFLVKMLLLIILPLLAFCLIHPTAHADTNGPSTLKADFAEGRVGAGFLQWLTISNMSGNACNVIVQEYYTMDGATNGQEQTVALTVNALTRYTDSVNHNLNISQNASVGATVSAVVRVDTASTPSCPGIVVERPMYFTNFHGTSSGTDIIGSTQLSQKFYFADVPTGTAGESFLAVFNPSGSAAHLIATYYDPNTGNQVTTDNLTVSAASRGTFQPGNDNLPAHTSVFVQSDIPVLVERPAYFPLQNNVSGSADVIGIPTPSADWQFAEGYTGAGTQENLVIANFGATAVTPTVTLYSTAGKINSFTLAQIPVNGQVMFNVNANAGASTQISADVNGGLGSNIVVERQMFTRYTSSTGWQAQGVSDAFGLTSPSSSFSFAEGFTSVNFNEWLELFNPGATPSNVTVNLVNMLGHTYSQTFVVMPGERFTVNVTDLVFNNLVRAGEDARAYAVSMSVNSSQNIVAERTMYWNAFGTTGTNAMVGYIGN